MVFIKACPCRLYLILIPLLLPDKITIFAEPLMEDLPDPEELREEIRLTVLHEIADHLVSTKKRSRGWVTNRLSFLLGSEVP